MLFFSPAQVKWGEIGIETEREGRVRRCLAGAGLGWDSQGVVGACVWPRRGLGGLDLGERGER
jgi:hypothetical protein